VFPVSRMIGYVRISTLRTTFSSECQCVMKVENCVRLFWVEEMTTPQRHWQIQEA